MSLIKDKYRKLFKPHFVANINGQQKMLTKEQLEKHWVKYVGTSIGYMYKNRETLLSQVKAAKKKDPRYAPVKLNMAAAQRGSIFAQTPAARGLEAPASNNELKEEIEAFQDKSVKKRKRIKANFERRKKLKNAAKSAKSEATKAKNKAAETQALLDEISSGASDQDKGAKK